MPTDEEKQKQEADEARLKRLTEPTTVRLVEPHQQLISLDEAKELLAEQLVEATEQGHEERLAELQKYAESEAGTLAYARHLNEEAQAEIERRANEEE